MTNDDRLERLEQAVKALGNSVGLLATHVEDIANGTVSPFDTDLRDTMDNLSEALKKLD